MKICSKCFRRRRLSSFYYRKRGPRAGDHYEKCKDCMKRRGRSYYHSNRERQLKLALIRKKKSYHVKRLFLNQFKDRPCADCGGRFPSYVMDFDHRKGVIKKGNISRMLSNSFQDLKVELTKCDIVCANCHRIRTYSKYAEIAKVVKAGA